jgi:predicted chitinase
MASIGTIDPDAFLDAYRTSFNKQLTPTAQDGLRQVVQFINAEPTLDDPRRIAYVLATIKHEAGETWQPIEEWGKGAGHPYGEPVQVTDPNTGATWDVVYDGRGYVQLTWQRNYRVFDEKLALRNQLWLHPETALDPCIAWQICALGMQQGLFTGKSLTDYIAGTTCDYVGARRIINGQDRAQLIAAYARTFEDMLETALA